MMQAGLDILLATLVLSVAAWTLAAREAFVAVVAFVTFGLLLALVWVRLAAVDAALTEAAIGGGVTGALLLGAASRLRPTEVAAVVWPGIVTRRLVALLCGAVSAGLAALVLFPVVPAPTLAPAAVAPLPALGLGNPVTGVLLAYRAVDTLQEKMVLLLAVVGVWSLAPDRFWGGAPTVAHGPPPSEALRFLAKILPPFGIVAAIYVLWIGATEPGGAFQAGTILAAMWILVLWAGLRRVPAIRDRRLRILLVAGPALFMAVGMAGLVWAGAFLAYPEHAAKAVIVAVEVALTVSIAVILGLVAAGPPANAPEP